MRSLNLALVASILSSVTMVSSNLEGATFSDVNMTICVKFVSHRESRYLPYTETYRTKKWGFIHRIQTRVNYRIEYNNVTTVERKCCPGYKDKSGTQYKKTDREAKDCEPVCTNDCVNGICVLPETCQCKPGYARVNETVCEAQCEDACIDGRCVAPNTCACNSGYAPPKNKTANVCEPVCEPPCAGNETCSAPNNCTCDEGYTRDEESGCVPVCPSSCPNGSCVAPNECRCFDGFYRMSNDSGFECAPTCARNCSGHGTCTEARQSCECDFGWTGRDCDEPSFCFLTIGMEEASIDGIVAHNETNSTLLEARDNSPYCRQCKDFLGNESLCYVVESDDAAPAVGCFIGTAIVVQTTLSHGSVATEALLSEEEVGLF